MAEPVVIVAPYICSLCWQPAERLSIVQACDIKDHSVCEACVWNAIPENVDWPACKNKTKYTLTVQCHPQSHVLNAAACASLLSQTEEDRGW